MSRFLLVLALVLNVAGLAQIQTLASDAGAATVQGRTYQLVDKDQRVGRNRQPVARPKDRIVFLNRTPGDYTPISQAPAKTPKQALVAEKQTIHAGWMKCDCGENCACLFEDICKNGDCKKNYVVLFTAKWCRACPRMKAVAEKLQKEGYIVYVIDFDEAGDKITQLKVTHLPTTLVFDGGKEVKRFVGVASIDDIKDGLKKKSDQPDKKPTSPVNPYSFR